MPRTKPLVKKLIEGTDMVVTERPSYVRIHGPISTVAYGFHRADGSIRLQVRRPDGQYPDRLIVHRDDDLPFARERLEEAEHRLDDAALAA